MIPLIEDEIQSFISTTAKVDASSVSVSANRGLEDPVDFDVRIKLPASAAEKVVDVLNSGSLNLIARLAACVSKHSRLVKGSAEISLTKAEY